MLDDEEHSVFNGDEERFLIRSLCREGMSIDQAENHIRKMNNELKG